MQYLEPWYELTELEATRLEEELRKEVTEGHRMFGTRVRAVARRQDRDEVLYALGDGTKEVAEVHLTWKPETTTEWPRVNVYPTLADWASGKMTRDHAEY